jgi:hypothetical protein
MASLETRVANMEKDAAHVNLKAMSDEELMAYARRFPMFSSEMYAAIVTLVLRRPSAFPVVYDDPDYQ